MPSTVPMPGAAGDSTVHSTTTVDLLNPDRWAEPTRRLTHVVQLVDVYTGQVVRSLPARSPDEADTIARELVSRYQVRILARCQWTRGCDLIATAVIAHPVLGEVAACTRCQRLAGAR